MRKNYLPHLAVTFSKVVEPVSTTESSRFASLELKNKVPESSTVMVVRGVIYALITTVWEELIRSAYKREEILSNSTIRKMIDIDFFVFISSFLHC